MIFQEVGGQHRGDKPRRQQREEHLHRYRDAELLEELPGDAGHEARRCEDRDDGEADGDHRQPDFVGGLQCCAIGRLAHPHVAHDVLDLDDGVVDQNAGRKRDGKKADEVQRKAENIHRPECRENRQRQRDRGDDGGANVAQKQHHDDDGENGAFEQRRDRRLIIALGKFHRGVDQLEIDIGIGNLQRIDPFLNRGSRPPRRWRPSSA